MAANEAERKRWDDERMAERWPKRERFTDAVTPYVLRALAPRPGEKMLEVGSGGGKLAMAAGQAVSPGGKVVGADISRAMVGLAESRLKAARASNVSFRVADVQTDSIPGGPFDAAISQFGVMFFEEPVTAFANIRAHLERGGRLAFACWQPVERNPWFSGPALAAFATPPPPLAPGKSPTGPFAFGNPRRVRGILHDAGFTAVTRSPHLIHVRLPADTLIDDAQLDVMGVAPEKRPEALEALRKHMEALTLPDGRCRFPLAFQVFTARNP